MIVLRCVKERRFALNSKKPCGIGRLVAQHHLQEQRRKAKNVRLKVSGKIKRKSII